MFPSWQPRAHPSLPAVHQPSTFSSSYAAAPRHDTFGAPTTYEEYDELRRSAELRALAAKQQKRREAEEKALREESDRRELEFYRAKARREALAEEEARRRQVEHEDAEYQRLLVAHQAQRRAQVAAAAQEAEYRRQLATRREQALHQCRCHRQSDAHQVAEAPACRSHRAQITQRPHHVADAHIEEDAVAEFFQRLFVGAGHQAPASTATAPARRADPVPAAVPAKVETPEPSAAAPSQKAPSATQPQEPLYRVVFHFDEPETSSPSGAAPSTSSAPSAPSTSTAAPASKAVETPEAIEAAETVQREYRANLLRRHQLSTLVSLATQLDAHQSSFVLPTALAFVEGEEKKLAYSPINTPLLAYEDFLSGLLSKIDEVQSGGDKVIKQARKDLVQRVETELRVLDGKKESDWRSLKGKAKEIVDDEAPSVGSSELTSTATDSETVAPFVVDDAATPADVAAATVVEESSTVVDKSSAPVVENSSEESSAPVEESSSVVDATSELTATEVTPAASSSTEEAEPTADSAQSEGTPLTPAALAAVESSAPTTSSPESVHSNSTETLSIPETHAVFNDVALKESGAEERAEAQGQEDDSYVVV